ncbi:hypothetical protein D3C81_1748390 [compost metagenome]
MNGTCISLMPAASAIISVDRWVELPAPALAKLSVPGLALAAVCSSFSDLMPLDLLATRRKGVSTTGEI